MRDARRAGREPARARIPLNATIAAANRDRIARLPAVEERRHDLETPPTNAPARAYCTTMRVACAKLNVPVTVLREKT
jgi:hypothetical protein